MIALTLSLDFACHGCDRSVCVTVKCSGSSLVEGEDQPIANVNVPCPHCAMVNRVSFEPSGVVRSVRAFVNAWPYAAPSLN